MPINRLTNAVPSPIRLGRIKKGDRGGKNGAPRDLDYWRIIFHDSPLAPELEKIFRVTYGAEPRSINVRFPSMNVLEIWDANYVCHRRGARIATAGVDENDNAYWLYFRHPETNEVLVRNGKPVGSAGQKFMEQPIDLTAPIYYSEKKHEPVYLEKYGQLKCVIPELTHVLVDGQPRPVLGFMEFNPKSPIDIRNISAELAFYDNLARSVGKTINGIPFQLIRRLEDVTVKIDGELAQKKMWVVHLDCGAGAWGRMAIEATERMALPDPLEYDEIIEADATDEEQANGHAQETVRPTPEPTKAMSFEEAKQVLVTVTNKRGATVQRFVGELNEAQLNYLIGNYTDSEGVEAARVVLAALQMEKSS